MTHIPTPLRGQVRERAKGRCEYCQRPDRFSVKRHHVDHIKATQHGGTSVPENLCYACIYCNTFKGPNLAAFDEVTQKLVPLYNPRTQKWDRHFEMIEAVIIGKTATGRATVQLLQMNEPKQIDLRRNLIESGFWD